MTGRSMLAVSFLGVLLGGPILAGGDGPAPPVKRTILQRHDLRAGGFEGVLALVELPAGGREGRHTHPAEVFVYVLEGTPAFDLEGHPRMMLKPGDSLFVEAGKIHEAINEGKTTAKLVAVFATEKGKPLTTPAP
jgi:quercetin dioxygenase-like cupin family protein